MYSIKETDLITGGLGQVKIYHCGKKRMGKESKFTVKESLCKDLKEFLKGG